MHTFTLPFDTSLIRQVRVLYAQNDTLVLVKETEDCKLDGKTITVTLTQKDTLLFDQNDKAEIQLRVLTTAGQALASHPKEEYVYKLLEDVEIE